MTFKTLITSLLLTLALTSQAQDLLSGSRTTNLLAADDSFLPVTEAFQLEARVYQNQLILHWDAAPGYYLYKERFRLLPGEQALPAPVFANPGINKYDEYFERDMEVYYHSATLYVDLEGITSPFVFQIESQGCADAGLCYPPHRETVRVDPEGGWARILTEAETGALNGQGSPPYRGDTPWLPQILLLALLGGIILNLMPCVFPVLSIKVMSLAQADRERLPLHGWAYTLGIVASFILFALALLAARAGGEAIGWGFQLQSPLLIAALVYLFFILGLGLSGLLNIGTRWMGAGQSLTQQSGLSGSFFTGVLAAVVASPCTAPFMGVALGFALTQPALVSLSVFIALGLGMALPLLLLCYLPGLAQRLPRPGPWMETLKEFLAFPLYLTAIWLLWVLGRQAGSDAVIAVCIGALGVIFSLWLLARPQSSSTGLWLRRLTALVVLLASVLLPWQSLNGEQDTSRWQAYSPERLQTLRAQGRPVFINLTADWCLTCLANERAVLSTEDIHQAFDTHNVATLKGDWTNRDPQITALLEEYGRSGVPLYLWFPAQRTGPADVLPQILTKGRVLAAITGENPN